MPKQNDNQNESPRPRPVCETCGRPLTVLHLKDGDALANCACVLDRVNSPAPMVIDSEDVMLCKDGRTLNWDACSNGETTRRFRAFTVRAVNAHQRTLDTLLWLYERLGYRSQNWREAVVITEAIQLARAQVGLPVDTATPVVECSRCHVLMPTHEGETLCALCRHGYTAGTDPGGTQTEGQAI